MPIVRNRLFQPVGVLLTDGNTLYLQSRQEVEVSKADLDSPHLKSMLLSDKLVLTEPADRVKPPPLEVVEEAEEAERRGRKTR